MLIFITDMVRIFNYADGKIDGVMMTLLDCIVRARGLQKCLMQIFRDCNRTYMKHYPLHSTN
jgi:hypothetical protein